MFSALLTLCVLLSARIGGMGPGLLGTLLGAALEWRLSPAPGFSPALFVFLATGIAVSLLTGPIQSAVRRAVERQKRETLDTLPTFVAVLAPDGIVKEVNRAALEAASLSRQDVVGKPFHEAYWWSHLSEFQERVQTALSDCAQGQPVHFETTLRQRSDHFLPVDIGFSLQEESVIVSTQDISQRIA